MAKREWLVYVGVFFAGAIFTPLVLSGFQGKSTTTEETATQDGDRPTDGTTESLDLSFDSPTVAANTPEIAPNDSQEAVLKDYTVTSPEALKQLPTTIPQYALNQPNVQPYPNYWDNIVIPSFSSPNQSSSTAKKTTKPAPPKSEAIAAPTSDLNGSINSTPAKTFIPPSDRSNSQPNGESLFNGNVQTSPNFEFKDFADTAPLAPADSKDR